MKSGRTPSCEKVGLKKGPWTPQEDEKLIAYVQRHGHENWRSLPAKAGLERCGKSCRLRWINYLRPDIKRGNFSMEEDRTIIQLHAFLGNKWSAIAAHLHKRTDNDIKNYWNSNLKKRLIKMGIDPTTHKPKSSNSTIDNNCSNDIAANLGHMAQWESARLQAEARESTLRVGSSSSSSSHPTARLMLSKIPPQPSPPPCLDVLKAWQRLGSLDQPSSPSPSTKHNTMYDMYAIMLATTDDRDLHSPVSTLSFQECKLIPNYAGNNNIDTTTIRGGIDVSSLQDDGDIMVAVEAFRAAAAAAAAAAARRDENIPELISNGAMDGLNNDMAPEEYGCRNFDSESDFQDWNTSVFLNLDYHSRNY